ncbi:CRPV-082 [Crowpox virus]|nr:CRPV-082 [Crowpox virus]
MDNLNNLITLVTVLSTLMGIHANYLLVTCKTGKLSNVADTQWKEDKLDINIMVNTFMNRFRNNDNTVKLTDKRRKVLTLIYDITNSSVIDWDSYRCYSCIVNDSDNSLPYISECNPVKYNLSSSSEYVSKVIVCRKPNKNTSLRSIINYNIKERHVLYRSKQIHTLSVIACVVNNNYYKLFGAFGCLLSVILLVIMIFSIIILCRIIIKRTYSEKYKYYYYDDYYDNNHISYINDNDKSDEEDDEINVANVDIEYMKLLTNRLEGKHNNG